METLQPLRPNLFKKIQKLQGEQLKKVLLFSIMNPMKKIFSRKLFWKQVKRCFIKEHAFVEIKSDRKLYLEVVRDFTFSVQMAFNEFKNKAKAVWKQLNKIEAIYNMHLVN